MGLSSVLASILPGALGRAFDFAEGWQERRKQESEARHEANLAKIGQQDKSWKDEYVLIIASYPPVSIFVPFLRDNTIESLAIIGQLPEWSVGLWVAIALSVYGVQKIPKVKK